MITTSFNGRLGNVLLEVYACFWLSKKKNDKYVVLNAEYDRTGRVDPSTDYIGDNLPMFENIKDCLVAGETYKEIVHKNKPALFKPAFKTLLSEEDVANVPDNVNLVKNTYRYPENAEDVKLFRQLFTVDKLISEQRLKYAEYFNNKQNIAAHIRRTDYEQFEDGKWLESSSDINNKLDKYNGCTIVVFSDDTAWCRDNIKSHDNYIIFHENQLKPYEDLVLMSLFSNIESNPKSSYSYCAKLLNKNIVEIPKRAI